jgi:polycomb protein EED
MAQRLQHRELGLNETTFLLRHKADIQRQNHNSYNTLCWTQDSITGKPLLCISGTSPKQIQIIDVESGTVKQSLVGHGRGLNDLAISPLSTSLLASASEDYTIRLWSLDPKHKEQPCVALFAGEGHRQTIQACSFHPNGKWMLSAGLDTAVCLWAVPSLDELERRNQNGTEDLPQPKIVYYPHFYSNEIHNDFVDNVVFYGDLILSRCAKDQTHPDRTNDILLWKIEGFNAEDDPPKHPPIPEPGKHTRSSFPHAEGRKGFQRLLTFDMPNTSRFYLRFGLLHQPDLRPILAMGDDKSRFMFWDLEKLEEGWSPEEERALNVKKTGRKPGKAKGKGKARADDSSETASSVTTINRLGELRRGTPAEGTRTYSFPRPPSASSLTHFFAADPSAATSTSFPPERKFDLGDPFMPLKPHRTIHCNDMTLSKTKHFATTQIAWSPDGCWMVAVGDSGMMCMFHRDKSVINDAG